MLLPTRVTNTHAFCILHECFFANYHCRDLLPPMHSNPSIGWLPATTSQPCNAIEQTVHHARMVQAIQNIPCNSKIYQIIGSNGACKFNVCCANKSPFGKGGYIIQHVGLYACTAVAVVVVLEMRNTEKREMALIPRLKYQISVVGDIIIFINRLVISSW
jgi:hypothetical protein